MSKKIYIVSSVLFQPSIADAAPAATKKITVQQQLIIDVLQQFIKIFGNNPSNAEKAWWRKRISCGEIKTQKALVSSMAFHKSKKVRKGSDTICGATAANSS